MVVRKEKLHLEAPMKHISKRIQQRLQSSKLGGKILIKMKKLMLGDIEACKEGDASCKAYLDTGCSNLKGPKASSFADAAVSF